MFQVIAKAPELALVAAHDQGSLQLVKLLGSLKWGLSDLESLPFGIAVPIHQALQALQQRPPTSLSPAEYVLIGREDLAATLENIVTVASNQAAMVAQPPPEYAQFTPAALSITPPGMHHHHHHHHPGFDFPVSPALLTEIDLPGMWPVQQQQREIVPVVATPGSVSPIPMVAVWPTSRDGNPVWPLASASLSDVWHSRCVFDAYCIPAKYSNPD